MAETIFDNRKLRGRPRVGSELIGVRVPPDQLAALDAWIAGHLAETGEPLSRPEALRRLAAEALKALTACG